MFAWSQKYRNKFIEFSDDFVIKLLGKSTLHNFTFDFSNITFYNIFRAFQINFLLMLHCNVIV
jgi:hypothetical protein